MVDSVGAETEFFDQKHLPTWQVDIEWLVEILGFVEKESVKFG